MITHRAPAGAGRGIDTVMHRYRVVIGFGIFAVIVIGLLFGALHYWPPH